MKYLGDYPANHTAVCIPFDSFAASTGASSATSNFAASDVQIYKDGGTTQRASSNGITVSTSFDGSTGLQMIVIDLSDDTDTGFYAAAHEYQVAVADITIDGQTVRFWAATFSIERANGVLAKVIAGTAKVDVTKWLTGTIPAVTVTGVPKVDAAYLLGTAWLTPSVAGTPDVNAKQIGGTAQTTGQDIVANITTLLGRIPSGIFTGITSLAQWLGALAGKQTANSTARTEIRATGAGSGTFDETTDSNEALRDNVGTNGASLSLAKTTNITGFNDIAASAILTTALTESYAADGAAPTLAQLLFMIWSGLVEFSISGTTITCKKLDGSTTSMTFTLDDATNPTSRTRAT